MPIRLNSIKCLLGHHKYGIWHFNGRVTYKVCDFCGKKIYHWGSVNAHVS